MLPAFGIVSEVLPVFSKKPLFGYPFVVFSGAAIGFVGWGVWAHHMFASGLGPVSVAVFSVATMAIAVPTGVKIINWTLTMWGGKLQFTTAMLFAIGLIVQFTLGGLSGVTHAVAPSDTQQTDTYYIVAHFHYVIFGGAVLGLFAGIYYWWPKIFGKMLNETWGKWNFWLMIIGMNLTFGPMHIIGLQGQPRRMYVWTEYRAGEGFFNLGDLEPRRHDRHVHPRRRHPAVPHQRAGHPPQAAGRRRSTRGTHASSSGSPRARRSRTTSTARRRCTRSTSSSIASTKTSAKATSTTTCSAADARRTRSPKKSSTPTPTSTCRRRRTGRWCWPCRCRSWPTASSTRRWLIAPVPRSRIAAMFGWALEPADAEDSDFDPPAAGDQTEQGAGQCLTSSRRPSSDAVEIVKDHADDVHEHDVHGR